jgi:hypothetical protein
MAEGIVLSLAAEKRELLRNISSSSNNSNISRSSSGSSTPAAADAEASRAQAQTQGIITRLSRLSVNRLQRALRAVPDDARAGAALADAFQTLAVAASRQGNAAEAERAFKMFRSLYTAPFARCSKTGLSYKDDILGIVVTVEYYLDYGKKVSKLSARGQGQGQGGQRPPPHGAARAGAPSCASALSLSSDVDSTPPPPPPACLRDWPIKECFVNLECLSLTAFLKRTAGGDRDRDGDGSRDGAGRDGSRDSSASAASAAGKERFVPLIIDGEHAGRALPLLMQELVRMDRLKENFYAFSVAPAPASPTADPAPPGSDGRGETPPSPSDALGALPPMLHKPSESGFGEEGYCTPVEIAPLSAALAWKAYDCAAGVSRGKASRAGSGSRGGQSRGGSRPESPLSLGALPEMLSLCPPRPLSACSAQSFADSEVSGGTSGGGTSGGREGSREGGGSSYSYLTVLSGVQQLPRPVDPPCLPAFDSVIGFRVISAVMNSMISQFAMQAERRIQVRRDSLFGYMAFHHMLLFFAARDPSWRETSNSIVEDFVQSPAFRHKDRTPDLGRFLVHLLLSDRGWDAAVSRAYVLECFRRQVSWYLKPADGKPKPGLAYLESDAVSPYRLVTTFGATIVGLRNLMFQIYFLHSVAGRDKSMGSSDGSNPSIVPEGSKSGTIAQMMRAPRAGRGSGTLAGAGSYASAVATGSEAGSVGDGTGSEFGRARSFSADTDASGAGSVCPGSVGPGPAQWAPGAASKESILNVYNQSLGCPTAALRKDINVEFGEILKVSSYDDFLKRIGLRGSPEIVTSLLRNAVRESYDDAGYHKFKLYGNSQSNETPGCLNVAAPKTAVSKHRAGLAWSAVAAEHARALPAEEAERSRRVGEWDAHATRRDARARVAPRAVQPAHESTSAEGKSVQKHVNNAAAKGSELDAPVEPFDGYTVVCNRAAKADTDATHPNRPTGISGGGGRQGRGRGGGEGRGGREGRDRGRGRGADSSQWQKNRPTGPPK